MTDKPIIFSAPMVRALLDGRKTQMRRLLKGRSGIIAARSVIQNGLHWLAIEYDRSWPLRLPYAPGDRLYVREAFCPRLGYPAAIAKPHYRADDDKPEWRGLWKPSIHMPRWASRLTLTVTEVRVQRLQEITGRDIISEGVRCEGCHNVGTGNYSACRDGGCFAGRNDFRDLWNSLHGPDAWDANPWVVALTFTVQHGNIDQVAS